MSLVEWEPKAGRPGRCGGPGAVLRRRQPVGEHAPRLPGRLGALRRLVRAAEPLQPSR